MDGEDMLAFRRREAMAKDPMAQSRLKNTKNGFEQRQRQQSDARFDSVLFPLARLV